MSNLYQLVLMLKNSKNPQSLLMNIFNNNSNNPVVQNLFSMINNKDTKGIEQLARNLAASKGINPDEMMKNIQNQFK